jgi:uncharacterized protein YndB with AHSA1/START domain
MKLRNEAPVERADEKARWVERETLVEASPEEVWEALTEEDRLEEWLAPEVELDPVEGGEMIEEQQRFAFTWSRPAEGESFVEFTIEALPGGTRVTVIETPIGPTAMAFAGWGARLARLRHISRLTLIA